jgi:hypothetical protein
MPAGCGRYTPDRKVCGRASGGHRLSDVRRLVQRFALAKTLDFWGNVERDGQSLNTAAEVTFHMSWKSINADCVAYIKRTVHA